jgi:predicted MFS family arabinose efflux permease
MVQGTGRNNGVKGGLLVGWRKETFGLIAVLGLLIGMMVAQPLFPKLPDRAKLFRLFKTHLELNFCIQ